MNMAYIIEKSKRKNWHNLNALYRKLIRDCKSEDLNVCRKYPIKCFVNIVNLIFL